MFVLEVLRFLTEKNDWLDKGERIEHVGYMKAKFRTKKDACSYYDKHNPHMRKMNQFKTYQSDWDPQTKLMYIVRKDYGLVDTIEPFCKEDSPVKRISDDGEAVIIKYDFLS